jgi:hypothetical protein
MPGSHTSPMDQRTQWSYPASFLVPPLNVFPATVTYLGECIQGGSTYPCAQGTLAVGLAEGELWP